MRDISLPRFQNGTAWTTVPFLFWKETSYTVVY